MDEKEYLRTKEKFKRYSQTAHALLFMGVLGWFFLVAGIWMGSRLTIIFSLLALVGGRSSGGWLIKKARDLAIELQCCPSCGKRLQPDWKVCGYCGKRLKKGD